MKKFIGVLCFFVVFFGGCKQTQPKSQESNLGEVILMLQQGNTPSAPQALIDDAQSIITRAKLGGYELILPEQLSALISSSTPFRLLDVSPNAQYKLGLIASAKNFEIPLSNKQADGTLVWEEKNGSQEKFVRKLGGQPAGMVVIYDSGEDALYQGGRADIACLWAKKLGFEKVYLLVGGFKAWKEQGYPTTLEAPSCCH